MKKILLAIAIMMIPFFVHAQKIEHDKVNALNKRIMYTNWEKVNWESDDYKLEVSFLLEGNDMSILFNWQCKEMVGAERDSPIVLFFDDMSKVVLNNKTFSVSGAGKVRTNEVGATAMGIQLDARGGIEDLRTISEKQLNGIRFVTTSGQIDIPVSKEEAAVLANLYSTYEKQFFKGN